MTEEQKAKEEAVKQKEKNLTWRDIYHAFYVKNKRTWFVTLNKFKMECGWSPLGWPRLEAVLSDGADCWLTFSLHCGLFGFYIGIEQPYLPKWAKALCGETTRIYGIYTCDSHYHIAWHKDDTGWAAKGKWKGFSFMQEWKRILKGKETTKELPGDIEMDIDWSTLPHPNYKCETVTFHVTRVPYITTYTRWPSFKWHRWNVKSVDGDLASAGKGENSWDQGENHGVDISFGFGCVQSAEEAVIAAVEDLHQTRLRRG